MSDTLNLLTEKIREYEDRLSRAPFRTPCEVSFSYTLGATPLTSIQVECLLIFRRLRSGWSLFVSNSSQPHTLQEPQLLRDSSVPIKIAAVDVFASLRDQMKLRYDRLQEEASKSIQTLDSLLKDTL